MLQLLANNKALVTKASAWAIGLLVTYLNRKFSAGMTVDDIHAMTALNSAFIIGVALHKPVAPVADGGAK